MPNFKKRRVGRTALEVTELGLRQCDDGGHERRRRHAGPGARHGDCGARRRHRLCRYGAALWLGQCRAHGGDALRFRPYVLSTKVGRLLRPVRQESDRTVPHPWTQPFPFEIAYDYSYDGIMRSFEASLQRLGLGRIDILLVHDIGTQTHGVEGNKKHWADLSSRRLSCPR